MSGVKQLLLAEGGGAVAAPYATWDVASSSNVTFSGGNLVITSAGGTTDHGAHVAGASGKTAGKYYFEVNVTNWAGGGDTGIGIATPTSTYAGMGGSATTGVMAYASNGAIWANGSSASASIGTLSTGTVVGIAVDLDNRKSWLRSGPSGNWNGSGTANPATNTGGVTIPAGTMVPFCNFNFNGNVFTGDFGASAFAGTVPSGFTSGWPA